MHVLFNCISFIFVRIDIVCARQIINTKHLIQLGALQVGSLLQPTYLRKNKSQL